MANVIYSLGIFLVAVLVFKMQKEQQGGWFLLSGITLPLSIVALSLLAGLGSEIALSHLDVGALASLVASITLAILFGIISVFVTKSYSNSYVATLKEIYFRISLSLACTTAGRVKAESTLND